MLTFITKISTICTGGNCMADVALLNNGKALVISDEAITLFDNPNDFLNEDGKGEVENGRELEDVGSVGRTKSGMACSMESPAFIERADGYEAGEASAVDLLILADGRVVGYDDASLWLYPNLRAFQRVSNGFIPKHALSMDVYSEDCK